MTAPHFALPPGFVYCFSAFAGVVGACWMVIGEIDAQAADIQTGAALILLASYLLYRESSCHGRQGTWPYWALTGPAFAIALTWCVVFVCDITNAPLRDDRGATHQLHHHDLPHLLTLDISA